MTSTREEVYRAILSKGEEWAAADEEARRLYKLEKVILAEVTNRQEGGSFAEKRSKALASPEYRLHLDRMVAAKTKANICLAAYEASKDLSNNRRAEMKAGL